LVGWRENRVVVVVAIADSLVVVIAENDVHVVAIPISGRLYLYRTAIAPIASIVARTLLRTEKDTDANGTKSNDHQHDESSLPMSFHGHESIPIALGVATTVSTTSMGIMRRRGRRGIDTFGNGADIIIMILSEFVPLRRSCRRGSIGMIARSRKTTDVVWSGFGISNERDWFGQSSKYRCR